MASVSPEMNVAVPLVAAFLCVDCGEICDEESPGSELYECKCGCTFNRDEAEEYDAVSCPDCDGVDTIRQIEEASCPECGLGWLRPVSCAETLDGQLWLPDDVIAAIGRMVKLG